LAVQFTGSGSSDDGSIASYSWNFGDGSPASTEANPSHTYTTVGAKTATLTVTDDDGATSTSSVVITPSTNQAPTAVANGTPLRGVRPLIVQFSSVGSVDPDCSFLNDCPGLTYEWDFGDGSAVSTEANPAHTYEDPDFYTATLKVTDNEGLSSTVVSLVVNARVENVAPVAAAAGSPTSGKEPLAVSFTSAGSADVEGDGSIVSYSWNFGDGSPLSTQANPSHTYQAAGDYTAVLTVTDNDGATASASVPITVNANIAPHATAAADVTAGHAPLPVSFSSAGSGDTDGTYSIHWDFGDGATSSAANPSHTYTNSTEENIVRTATLTVTDDNGATAISTIEITVWPVNKAPVAVISTDRDAGKTPLTVSFVGSGSSDPDGTVESYEWDFKDGNTSTNADEVHTFTTAGTYNVTLKVTDDDGATKTATKTITVVDNVAPVAHAQSTPSSGKAIFTTFQFNGGTSTDSDGVISDYSWNFGDGSGPVTGVSPTHVYSAAGTYEVVLTVTDDYGTSDTDTISVTVVDNIAPTAAASVTPGNGKTNITTFNFRPAGTTDSDGTIASYSWDFGDGSALSTAANPSKMYSTAGNYLVTLTVTDDNGATGTATTSVTVLDNVAPTAAPTVNLTTGTTATNFNFAANAADSDGTVTGYLWNFGNGTFATTASVSNKKFTAPGTYNVTVTVTDNNGASTTSAPITITIN
jgi:PKD repeat protein